MPKREDWEVCPPLHERSFNREVAHAPLFTKSPTNKSYKKLAGCFMAIEPNLL
jgi:hypothetical protein